MHSCFGAPGTQPFSRAGEPADRIIPDVRLGWKADIREDWRATGLWRLLPFRSRSNKSDYGGFALAPLNLPLWEATLRSECRRPSGWSGSPSHSPAASLS